MTTSLVLMSAILGASIDLFEGDILGFDLYQKNAVLYQSERVWPDGIIPYVVSQQFSKRQRKMINKAMKQYRSRTCIKFIPRASDHSNYINITMTGSGCFSYVGRNGGGQLVSLDDYCFRRIGTIVHELMHVAGFYHEQSRTDRDDYVTIIWDNIQPDFTTNFLKFVDVQNLGPYDYGSVMHYPSNAFSRNRALATIIPILEDVKIGQRQGFSEIDVLKLNELYGCHQADPDISRRNP